MHISNLPQTQAVAAKSTSYRTEAVNKNRFAEILSKTHEGNAAAKTAISTPVTIPDESFKPVMVTDKGNIEINLDHYFSNEQGSIGFLNINELPPILLPSAQNIEALTEHVSTWFKQMLAEYNIPSAPNKITFDNQGKMHIPIDYPHANELNRALEENPGIKRELSTVNALSGHYVEIQARMPFIEEMGRATSQAVKDQIIAKYSHLLHDNHDYQSLALVFSKDGDVSVTADGELVKFS
jgi:hypothetical protein